MNYALAPRTLLLCASLGLARKREREKEGKNKTHIASLLVRGDPTLKSHLRSLRGLALVSDSNSFQPPGKHVSDVAFEADPISFVTLLQIFGGHENDKTRYFPVSQQRLTKITYTRCVCCLPAWLSVCVFMFGLKPSSPTNEQLGLCSVFTGCSGLEIS